MNKASVIPFYLQPVIRTQQFVLRCQWLCEEEKCGMGMIVNSEDIETVLTVRIRADQGLWWLSLHGYTWKFISAVAADLWRKL